MKWFLALLVSGKFLVRTTARQNIHHQRVFTSPHHIHSYHPLTHPVSIHHLPYSPVPAELVLQKVAVITRHGDRAQISKSLGPRFPSNDELIGTWSGKLPSESTLRTLLSVASADRIPNNATTGDEIFRSNSGIGKDLFDEAYAGRDVINFPFGMLTERGVQQLQAVGAMLRNRYLNVNKVFEQASGGSITPDQLYLRSTNVCRTILSLRSLLTGLIHSSESDSCSTDHPHIHVRAKQIETMYPDAQGPCKRLRKLSTHLQHKHHHLVEHVCDYPILEQKVRHSLGYTDKDKEVPWVDVKEVSTCHFVHDLPLPGLHEDDVAAITKVAGRIWGLTFKDHIINKFAVGRFISELLDDLKCNLVNEVSTIQFNDGVRATSPRARMLLYSGHDSTIVPLLCALGLYEDIWPPYASYIGIEVARRSPNAVDESVMVPCQRSGLSYEVEGSLFARVVYNDAVLHVQPTALSEWEGWIPLYALLNKLESQAISEEQYAQECFE